MEEETVFSNSPLMVAKKWEELGAKLLHVVDLDGAIAGEPRNGNIVIEIAKSVSIPIEIGGGIRDFKTAEKYFNATVSLEKHKSGKLIFCHIVADHSGIALV